MRDTSSQQKTDSAPWEQAERLKALAKTYGGTDGHKFVNGVLNGLAPQLRAAEVEADKAAGKAS